MQGRSIAFTGGISALLIAASAPALAQAQDTSIGEVVVTASKRETNLQDLPQAVSVVSGAQLEASSVNNFTDLPKVAPSLIVRPDPGLVNSVVSIRGVGTYAFGIGVESSVAVQIDDVPVTFAAQAFNDLSDVQRIEVLRGPQSTLYGKSASAGLINIVTAAPTKDFTGRVGGTAASDGEYIVNAGVSGPITDTVSFRLSGNYASYDGNVYNRTLDTDINGRKVFVARGKLAWDPTPDFNAWLGLSYDHGKSSTGFPFIALSPAARLRGDAAISPSVFAPGVTARVGNTDMLFNTPLGSEYQGFGQALHATFQTAGPSIVSITSHGKYHNTDHSDVDGTAVEKYDNSSSGRFENEQFTEELRLVSPGNQKFRYTLGLFYADVDFGRQFRRGPLFSLARWNATASGKQKSAFGQVEWDVLPATTLIGGVRFGQEDIGYTFLDIQNGNAFFKGGASADYNTYKLGVQQKLTDDVMVFATYATGYKGQTFDLSTGFNALRAAAGPVRPEHSKDFEAGARTQFFDRRLTLNATYFDTRYRDLQAQGVDTLPDGTQNFRLRNIGRQRSRGVELDAGAVVGQSLTLGASIAYLDAKILSFPGAPCYPAQTSAQGCFGSPAQQNLSGTRPGQSPRWRASLNGEYRRPIWNELDGFAATQITYQSASNLSSNNDPQTNQKGYAIVNLTIGIRAPGRKYEIAAFVNNLTNEHYFINFTNQLGNFGNQTALGGALPRDFFRYAGVRLAYKF